MRREFWLTVLCLLTFAAATALGSEDAHGHGQGGIPWAKLVFSTVNLGIFVAILARFVFPQVRCWVRDRQGRIVKELQDAAAAKAEAERLRAEWERRLAQFERNAEEMREQTKRDAQRERERIVAEAERTADGIRRDAERAAVYERRRAEEQLRARLVGQAIGLAEQEARERWTAADQERFVAEFVQQVRRG
jgi:F-type H+-transporting ATPase subunit b